MLPESKRPYYEDKKYKNVKKSKKYSKDKIITRYGIKYNLNFRKDVNRFKRDFCFDMISKAKEDGGKIVSLNKEVSTSNAHEDSNELMNFVADPKESNNPTFNSENDDMKKIIREIINDPEYDLRSREVVRMRHGVPNTVKKTNEEICIILKDKEGTRTEESILKDIKEIDRIYDKHPEIGKGNLESVDLTPYQKELIELKYAVVLTGEKTLECVGDILKLTRERIRQLEGKLYFKLKKSIKYKRKTKDYIYKTKTEHEKNMELFDQIKWQEELKKEAITPEQKKEYKNRIDGMKKQLLKYIKKLDKQKEETKAKAEKQEYQRKIDEIVEGLNKTYSKNTLEDYVKKYGKNPNMFKSS